MLEINNIRKFYNKIEVLNIPELSIQKGEIIGLVGNNGAGKTTLFSLILDLIEATKGTVTSKGEDVSKSEHWKKYTAAFLDEGFLIGFLTADEYFEYIGKLHNLSPVATKDFVSRFEEVFNGEITGKKKYIRDLSKGNQKKVGLVSALIGDPELVIWDEPFSNLDPSTQLRVRGLINQYSDNRTFLISSHDLNHIAEVCTRIIILDHGQVVKDIQRSETTKEALLEFFTPV
ncbi:MAG: ABC transporter ATP-binding protein [Bacteroidota bacterium]